MRNFIDFDKDPIQPELIPTRKTKPELIPTRKTKPELIPTRKPNKIDKLMRENLMDFTKDPYKQFSPYQSVKKIQTEVRNTLLSEIKNPLTKDILGLKLTKDLKEKISKLTTEAAIGLAWIIRALIISNKGKLPVYYSNKYIQLTKTQIKEIIEYYFSSLALLLNPAQKTLI